MTTDFTPLSINIPAARKASSGVLMGMPLRAEASTSLGVITSALQRNSLLTA